MRYALRLVALTSSLTLAFILGPAASDSQAQIAARRAARANRANVAKPAPVRYYYVPAPVASAPAPTTPAPAQTRLTSANGPSTFSYSSGYSATSSNPPAVATPRTPGYYYSPAPAPPTRPQGRVRPPAASRRPQLLTSDDDPYAYKS
jgi:hypothetical protein